MTQSSATPSAKAAMDRQEASESVAENFTRVMCATPSPLGVFCDFMPASVVSAVILLFGLFAIRRSTDATVLYVVLAVAAAPLVASALISATLRGSREKVVDWLSSLPFPIENMNALLAGLGDTIEVVFEAGVPLPSRATLQPKLDEVSDDVLLVKERPEERLVEIRLGVIDSKRLPQRTNHHRWRRLVDVVERVLVPLSKTAGIEKVHVV
jgi:hypothetical protein